MLLKARPLFDNRSDAQFFVPPSEWESLTRAIERQVNVLLIGPRGVGKTSTLRQLQRTLRDQDERTAFVDANSVDDVLELASQIRDVLRGRPSAASMAASSIVGAISTDPEPVAGASRALGARLEEIAATQATTILLDASSSGSAVYELFGRHRDVLWEQEHRWVVAVGDADRTTVLKPPADAFFDVVLSLEPWSAHDLADLLNLRGEDDRLPPDLVVSAATKATGNPRKALHALSDAIVKKREPAELLDERAQLLDRAAEVGRAPAMLMAELLDGGSASPSDDALQETLGLTRSRLTQLLRKLLDEGLVIAEVERSDGPGRPRTIYRPALKQ